MPDSTTDSSVYTGMGVLAANQTGTETQHWQDAWQVDGLGNYLDHQRVDQTVRRSDQV